jgi:hypothetical protein
LAGLVTATRQAGFDARFPLHEPQPFLRAG